MEVVTWEQGWGSQYVSYPNVIFLYVFGTRLCSQVHISILPSSLFPSPSGPHRSGDDLDKMDKTLVVDILVHAGAPVLTGDRKEGRAGRGVAGRGGAEEAELKEVKHDLNGGGGLLTTITITSTAELWWLTNTFFCPLRNKF